ncbi:MAG: outer membrane lipoprotein carrier protein LolA [Acidobacteriia bacterium]|nr:outer membrane lipoprotein carrier protein LolA [Terriglobia bacterium]
MRLLESRYSGAKTLRAVFFERYLENGRQVRAESGTVLFRRPGKMRWEYESPESKVFVSDGRTIWFYVPADRTALRSTVKENADERTPFGLLTRNPRVSHLCARIALGAATEAVTPGNLVLHCRPHGTKAPAQGAGEILLEIAPETGDLSRVQVDEGGGSAIEFRFSQWEKNGPVEDSVFHFTPPLGVAIVDAPAGEVNARSGALR